MNHERIIKFYGISQSQLLKYCLFYINLLLISNILYYKLFKDINKEVSYLVFEYNQGDLRKFLMDNKEHLNWEEKRRLAIQIVEGLRYLHETQNIAHRNLVRILF